MTFRQGVSEIVYEAWSRFRKMLRNCPDHNIPRHIQVHTFYHGLTDGGKDKLDHLNGDSFLSGTTAECHNLLNNLAANQYEKKSERATPSKAARVIEVDQVTALNAKIDFLMQSMKNFGVNQVQHTPVTCEDCGESHPSEQCPHSVEFIQFVSNFRKPQNNPYSNTYNPGWRQHPNFSWNNNQGQGSAPRFQQSGQQQVQRPMQEKKPSLEETLIQFMASTAANFEMMETQIGQLANAINSRHQGSLPSNTEPNPRQEDKAQCQAVTLYNGRELQEVVKEPTKPKGKEVKFMKDIVSKKRRLGDYEMVALTEEYSAIIQNKLPPKLKDPGSFTMPCTIGTHFSGRALCDLGASINLMPYSIYSTLGLGEAKNTSITLQLADRSLTYPKGVIEDILVKVDKFIFPADFIVLDMEVDSEIPIILGRPFLATGRILIDAMKFPNESDEYFSVSLFDNLVGNESIAEQPLDPLERALLDRIDEDNEEDLEVVRTLDASKYFKSREVESLEKTAPSKRGGITVVPNMHNELIPTRTVTGWRVCMDYRKLNKATRKDHFPLPFIDQMLDRLAGKEFYYFLDGYSGYNQIAIAPEDQEKTTFTCPYGTFAFRRMPFGLCNAPATFQRCMMAIFTDMVENFLEVFMDDFSVYGNSFDECLNNLSSVLKRCEDTNLVLNWEKCHFMVQEGIVLGHKVSNRGIEVDKAKLETIEKLPPPTSVKGVRNFLGHVGDFAIGAVLGQRKDKISRSIYYASKTLNDAQLNYTTTKKELLAIVFAFDKFRSYLVGTKVIVYTDHAAIRYLIEKKDAKPRLIRWKKFLFDTRRYFWDDPFLFKQGPDYILRRCVPEVEMNDVLEQCHASPHGGHFQGDRTAAKILQSGFFFGLTCLKMLTRHCAEDPKVGTQAPNSVLKRRACLAEIKRGYNVQPHTTSLSTFSPFFPLQTLSSHRRHSPPTVTTTSKSYSLSYTV
ncbi:DNA-directed DNA polymerase [Handroanthus impetiginosus]|uniref:RNA-directed DNA polymerase n=1 Tax=Handroanthus impetiginosus TaxID=429701 RepID=A0A2G9HJB6_9LAMI|nr:DNA-directed DNA polymerase [Handroanthus impetiginosus]